MKNYTITVNGKVYEVTVEEGFTGKGSRQTETAPQSQAAVQREMQNPAVSAPSGGLQIKAPMPGKILDIKVSVGQAVKRGEVLMILEAMKMENEIVASEDGTVAAILAAVGASVEAGDILAALNA